MTANLASVSPALRYSCQVVLVQWLIGEMEQANQIARGCRILSLDAAISRFRQALLSVALGDAESALSFLKLAVEDEEAKLVWIGVDPRFDSMRQTAGFKDLAFQVVPQY
jgi:hypothetical protein